MLRNVHIKNMALIDEIEVNFENGLNVMTGETGAGKSIILGAMMIALGGKTGKEMLRDGAEYGLVEVLFEIDNPATKKAIQDLELSLSEDDVLIISRKIYPNRTTNKINDEMVTVSKLKEIAGVLIDIHSQHEHQSLLKKSNHLHIVDEYGKATIQEKKSKVAELYHSYFNLQRELHDNQVDEETRRRQLDFARFEINEIQTAKLIEGEEEELEAAYRKMVNGKQIMECISTVYQCSGYEQTGSAGEQLGRALSNMEKAADMDSDLSDLQEQLATIDNLLNDFNRELSNYISELTFDEQQYREVERRLDLIHNLEAKYGRTILDILQYLDEKEEEVRRFEDYEEWKQEMEARCEKAWHSYASESEQLSKLRQAAAKKLVALIIDALQDLNFLDVRFEMKFDKKDSPDRDGMDDAYFMISTNVGEQLRPLWEVASGGELSRIMLAIKSCLAKEDAVDTLVFDEIDVGISGRTAQLVSEKLMSISKEHQVICISHLPQIAAMADYHYKIEKKVIDQKTQTNIWQLQETESIEEIARILGGVEITDTVLQNATEMKQLANAMKQ